MTKKKASGQKLIGLTGPSMLTKECVKMVEKFYDANFVMLYHDNEKNLLGWVDQCVGVIVAGGLDIHPSVMNCSVFSGMNLSKFDMERDIRELQVIEHCLETKKPLLGICRGHQLIGIKQGFTLLPDLSGSPYSHQPRGQQISLDRHEPAHSVDLLDPELYFEIFTGKNPEERRNIQKIMGHDQNSRLWVNSFHHQGLWFPPKKHYPQGTDAVIFGTARIDLDKQYKNIIELMVSKHWLSCQWHPEWDWEVNTASRAVLQRFQEMLNGKVNNLGQQFVVEEDEAEEAGDA